MGAVCMCVRACMCVRVLVSVCVRAHAPLHVLTWPRLQARLAPFQVLTGETLQLSLGMA